jgi:hypothetical protein
MKQDDKRLSKEKHEIAYVRKLAKKDLKYLKGKRGIDELLIDTDGYRRICQAVIKFAKYKK